MKSRPSENRRLRTLGFFLGAGLIAAVATQANLQIVRAHDVSDRVTTGNRMSVAKTVEPPRGRILSRDGVVLAESENVYEFSLHYERLPQSPAFFQALSRASGISTTELKGTSGVRVWWRAMSPSRAQAISRVQRDWRADGVSLKRSTDRLYPLAEATSTILGRLQNGQPVSGLELGFNDALSGQAAEVQGFIDGSGWFVATEDGPDEMVPGSTVTLTLDSELQVAATQAVRSAVEAFRAKSGTAVVLDPSDGAILAMANWPSFDPSRPVPEGGDFNPAIMGAYEPGSTFKVLTLGKALDVGGVSPTRIDDCGGTIAVSSRVNISCHISNGVRAKGRLTLDAAIARSCNVSSVRWGDSIGRDRMIEFFDSMHLFERPGLGLPSESNGIFNRNDGGPRIQLANLSFGQAMNATPVMLAAAYGMLANDGEWNAPYLISAIDGEPTERPLSKRILQAASAQRVRETMVATFEMPQGTAHSLRIPGYELAGKTGTAQKTNRETGAIGGGGYVASFVGFVPAQRPQAVILVMIDEPREGGYYGGRVAGPVFRDIARTVIRRYNIPPTTPETRLVQSVNGGETL